MTEPSGEGNGMLWLNVLGLAVVAVLLGTFFVNYGGDLVGLLTMLSGGGTPVMP